MPEWLSGVSVGFLFFFVTVFSVLRRKTGNVVARNQYPKVAQKWGLKYVESAYPKGVGRLEGTVGGFEVKVDPDDQRRIFLKFAHSPPVALHSYVHNKRALAGQRSFRPISSVLAFQFKTAQASPAIIDALNGADSLSATLRPLKFIRELKTLSVTEGGVSAIFDYGSPPYIPGSIVDDLLPRLAELAAVIEAPSLEGPPQRKVAGADVPDVNI